MSLISSACLDAAILNNVLTLLIAIFLARPTVNVEEHQVVAVKANAQTRLSAQAINKLEIIVT